jgi:hypothetical protein
MVLVKQWCVPCEGEDVRRHVVGTVLQSDKHDFCCFATLHGLLGPFSRSRFRDHADLLICEVTIPNESAVVQRRRGLYTVAKTIRVNRLLSKEEVAHMVARDHEIKYGSARVWMRDGRIHREDDDEPTVIIGNGSKWWYTHHCRHRAGNKPAYEGVYGTRQY